MIHYKKYKVTTPAICRIKDFAYGFTKIARLTIEMDAEGFDDWQEDGGYWHNEGELNIDYTSARPVCPEEYEVLLSDKIYEGKRSVVEIVEVFKDSVFVDSEDIEEVEED